MLTRKPTPSVQPMLVNRCHSWHGPVLVTRTNGQSLGAAWFSAPRDKAQASLTYGRGAPMAHSWTRPCRNGTVSAADPWRPRVGP